MYPYIYVFIINFYLIQSAAFKLYKQFYVNLS